MCVAILFHLITLSVEYVYKCMIEVRLSSRQKLKFWLGPGVVKYSRGRCCAAGQSSEMGLYERPWSRGFPAFKIGIRKEFFQIAGMSTPSTERLKSSAWKARRPHSDGGGCAYLMASATPFSLNGLYERSTLW